MSFGQRRKAFPDRDTRGEIQDISKNRVTLGARWIRKGRFLPLQSENEDGDAKHQRIEYGSVEHGDKEECRGAVRVFIYPGRYGMSPVPRAWDVQYVCQPCNLWPPHTVGHCIVIGADSYLGKFR